jgi:hypothetical protein
MALEDEQEAAGIGEVVSMSDLTIPIMIFCHSSEVRLKNSRKLSNGRGKGRLSLTDDEEMDEDDEAEAEAMSLDAPSPAPTDVPSVSKGSNSQAPCRISP